MGAKPGHKHSEETKAKMRAAQLAHPSFKGRKHSQESIDKMRASDNASWAVGRQAVNWKGGRVVDSHGYVLIYAPDHPNAVGNYVAEHRLVMEKKLGRPLLREENIHHINHDRQDNRPENLMILSRGEHSRLHRLLKPNLPSLKKK